MRSRNCVVIGLAFALLAGAALAQTIPNWTAPPTWTPSKGMTATTMADLSNPVPFIPVTPCRVADTRNPNGAYGGPALVGALTRDFTIGGQCGIPSGAEAVSFNFTITGGTQAGDLRFYPAGSVLPLVSTINWGPTTGTLANAAVVPLGTAGAITVKNDSAAAVHLIIDVNGFYDNVTNTAGEYFGITGSYSAGGGIIYGFNNYAGGLGYGGNFGSASGYDGAAGVHGYDNAAPVAGGAVVAGVHGGTSQSAVNNVAGVRGTAGPSFPNTACCGPGGVRGEGAFNGMAGVSQDRATVGVLVDTSGAWLAEGQLGKIGNSATQAYGVVGATAATASNSAGVYGTNTSSAQRTYGVVGIAGPVTWFSPNVFMAGGHFAGAGANSYGVVADGLTGGLMGIRVNSSGAMQNYGAVGYLGSDGLYSNSNLTVVGTKSFAEPHPTDASKVIKYVCLEGPEAGTYFRGKARFEGRTATIDVPENFRFVTDPEGLSIQVTPIGDLAAVAVVSIGLDQIELKSSRDVEFFYTVNGVRKAFKDFQPVQDATDEMNPYFIPESASQKLEGSWPAEIKQKLVRNGTYNEDGTVNLNTAERLGWAQKWRDREAAAQKAAEEAAAKAATAAAQRERENPREP